MGAAPRRSFAHGFGDLECGMVPVTDGPATALGATTLIVTVYVAESMPVRERKKAPSTQTESNPERLVAFAAIVE